MKILKKSFEDFVNEHEKYPGKEIILTGNMYEDLKAHFFRIAYRNMFYELPRDYAYDICTDNHYSLRWFKIELFKNDNSFLLLKGYFQIYENGYIHEWIVSDDDIIMRKFVLPMRELIKQIQQYYVDHDLVDDKKCCEDGSE